MKRFSIVVVLIASLALACSACRDSGKAANQGNKDAIAGIGNAVTNPSGAAEAPAAGATVGAAGSGAAGTTGGSADATGTGTVGGATATSGATGTSAATGTAGTTGTSAASRKNIPATPGPDWQGKPKEYGIKVVKEYPHDETSYTQGLFFQGDHLIETTGQKGESTLRKVDLATGKALKRFDFDRKYFLEGSVELNGKIFILTWLNKVAFIYDASSLEYLQTFSYPREGWGLTTDGTQLIASDGSSKLFFMDERFQLKKTLQVRLDGKPLRALNELEWIGGKVWANVYLTDMIVVIDPQTGNVEAKIDCTGLLPEALRDEYTDVLNGIAFNPADGKLYLTGKYWKRLYEVELVER